MAKIRRSDKLEFINGFNTVTKREFVGMPVDLIGEPQAWEAVVLPLNYARARARITRIWAGEKQAPQALWRCGVGALRLRRSPTASASVAYACSHGLTEIPPIRICTRVAGFCHGGNHAMIQHDSTPAQPNTWAVHFPGNLRWTNAMQIVKGMVP